MDRSVLRITFKSPEDTPLKILSRTLEDFDTHLELAALLADPRRDSEPIPGQWRSRRRSRLPKEDQILVGRISRSSPLVIEIAQWAGTAGLGWVVVQAVERLVMLPGQYQLQKLAIKEKELVIAKMELDLASNPLTEDEHEEEIQRGDLLDIQERTSVSRRYPGDPMQIQQARRDRDLDALIVARRASHAWRQSLTRLREDLPVSRVDGPEDEPS